MCGDLGPSSLKASTLGLGSGVRAAVARTLMLSLTAEGIDGGADGEGRRAGRTTGESAGEKRTKNMVERLGMGLGGE